MLINLPNKYRDTGLLLLRIGIGGAFVLIHGLPKITGGPELWKGLGGAMSNLGITFMPEFWGLLSALAEFGGGILLLLGLFTRPAAFFMLFNMCVALTMHFSKLDPWSRIAHPLELAAILLAVLFIGAGKYSLDYLISSRKHVIVKYVKAADIRKITKPAGMSDAVKPVI
jgi:putative oxidoreductase